MAKPLKITCIIPELGHGLFYQRLRIPFNRLDPEKFSVHYTLPNDIFLKTDNTTDIFVIAHPSSKFESEMVYTLKQRSKRVIVDIDDLLTNVPSCHPEADMLHHCKWMVPDCLMQADHVVTSTKYLADQYSHYNTRFSVIENSLDTTVIPTGYVPVKKPYKTMFTVGWCGGFTHVGDQYEFAYGLEKFLDSHESSRAYFRPIAPEFLVKKFGVRCTVQASYTHFLDYHTWLATLGWDVCLVGLVDHPFNDAKSDLRFIECARHGIPIIASPRDDFKKHIEAGRALGASTNDEFAHQLNYLYEEPRDIGKAAKEYVESCRLDVHAAAKWSDVLLDVMDL